MPGARAWGRRAVPAPAGGVPAGCPRAAGCGWVSSQPLLARRGHRIPQASAPPAWDCGCVRDPEGSGGFATFWGCCCEPRISAGPGLAGAPWGAGGPQIALEGRPGCPREVLVFFFSGSWREGMAEEKARSYFFHCSTMLRWESGTGELQSRLGAVPTALRGCVWSEVQSPGAGVSKPCSWQSFREPLPRAPGCCRAGRWLQSADGTLVGPSWDPHGTRCASGSSRPRASTGWHKAPREGQMFPQTHKVKSCPPPVFLYCCSTHARVEAGCPPWLYHQPDKP